MSVYLDISYVKQLSYRLDRYKETSINPFKANARCPLCGDSQKKMSKTRFWMFEGEGNIRCHCFNCGASMSFGKFLKTFDHNLYERYRLENFKDSKAVSLDIFATEKETESYIVPDILKGIQSIDDLSKDHPARKYVVNRLIEEQYWSKLYYVHGFFKWAKGHEPEMFKHVYKDHPRIVIPWFNMKGECFAYSARSMNGEEPKYYKIKINKKDSSYFGMERVKLSKQVFVCEGPLDALMIDNCIAVGNANIGEYQNKDAIYIPDRDVRNVQVMKIVEGLVNDGRKVFLAPEWLHGKDMNNYLESGLTKKELQKIIVENTYQGLAAKLHFSKWRKVIEDEVPYWKKIKGDR